MLIRNKSYAAQLALNRSINNASHFCHPTISTLGPILTGLLL